MTPILPDCRRVVRAAVTHKRRGGNRRSEYDMSDFYIGAEVGAADDHDTRGVIVDSHPDRGWLVWWCGAEVATWHRVPELWLRDSGSVPVYDVLDEINSERLRQRAKGFDAAHDDGHYTGGLAAVAAALIDDTGAAARASGVDDEEGEIGGLYAYIMRRHYSDRHRQLIIAAALLVAEIERLDRAHDAAHYIRVERGERSDGTRRVNAARRGAG